MDTNLPQKLSGKNRQKKNHRFQMNLGNCLLAVLLACRGMAVDSNDTNVFGFEHLVAQEPFAQFEAWFDEATKHEKVTTE